MVFSIRQNIAQICVYNVWRVGKQPRTKTKGVRTSDGFGYPKHGFRVLENPWSNNRLKAWRGAPLHQILQKFDKNEEKP